MKRCENALCVLWNVMPFSSTGAFTAVIMWKNRKPKKVDWPQYVRVIAMNESMWKWPCAKLSLVALQTKSFLCLLIMAPGQLMVTLPNLYLLKKKRKFLEIHFIFWLYFQFSRNQQLCCKATMCRILKPELYWDTKNELTEGRKYRMHKLSLWLSIFFGGGVGLCKFRKFYTT